MRRVYAELRRCILINSVNNRIVYKIFDSYIDNVMTKADTSMLIKNIYSYSVVKVFKFRKGKSSTPVSDTATCLVPIWSPIQVHLQSSYFRVCGSAQSKVSLNMQLTGTRLLLLMELINCFQRNLANFKKIGRFKYYLIYFDLSNYLGNKANKEKWFVIHY